MTRPRAPIMQAYFDDSGGDPKSPIYAIAGYLAIEPNAGAFSQKWSEVLDGPPRIQYWHTNTARGGYGGKFDAAQMQDREVGLAQLIAATSGYVTSLSVELDKSLFDSVVLKRGALNPDPGNLRLSPMVLSVLSNPFYILFHHAMLCCWITASRMTGIEGTQIFMEDADGAEWQDQVCLAARAFRRLAPLEKTKAIASVTFAPGKGRISMPALEAADLWAWHVRRRATYPEEPVEKWPARILLESCKGDRVIVKESLLRDYVAAVNAGARL